MSGLRTTSVSALVVTAAVSAPAGAAIGPLVQWTGGAVPRVPWSTVASPWFLALVVGLAAWQTWRLVGGEPPWRRTPDRPPRPREDESREDGRPRASRPGQVGVGRRLAPHQAVNRLVLGKAAALAGAVCAGAYVGFAVAALGGVERQLDGERVLHSLVAAAGGLALLVAGVLLERACRTQDPGEPDLA
ncbi:DUF3180 family protein [Nocardioidaceae bacterium]|nr:DUF3180 family protein [Nocardioidaceae bacterium]